MVLLVVSSPARITNCALIARCRFVFSKSESELSSTTPKVMLLMCSETDRLMSQFHRIHESIT